LQIYEHILLHLCFITKLSSTLEKWWATKDSDDKTMKHAKCSMSVYVMPHILHAVSFNPKHLNTSVPEFTLYQNLKTVKLVN